MKLLGGGEKERCGGTKVLSRKSCAGIAVPDGRRSAIAVRKKGRCLAMGGEGGGGGGHSVSSGATHKYSRPSLLGGEKELLHYYWKKEGLRGNIPEVCRRSPLHLLGKT